MSRLNNHLKKIIKSVSGYNLVRRGYGLSNFLVLAKDNLDIQCVSDTLVLTNKTQNEVRETQRIYLYLQQLRLKTILKKHQINIVLDVGANRGQFATDLRAIGYQGKIISFEPVSSTFNLLKNVASEDPMWDVYQLALGGTNGEQTINVSDSSVFTSFLQSNSWCEERFGKTALGSQAETVMIRRLDEVLSERIDNLDQARIYLKMDTQGYDLEVFAGIGSIQNRIFALQSEVSVIPIYQNMPHLTESISFFEKNGFELAGLYPVTLDESTLRIIEFDCVMINSRLEKEVSPAT